MLEDVTIAHCCWALQGLTLAVSFLLFNLSLILNTDFSILSYTYLGLSDRTCQMFSKHIRKMGHFAWSVPTSGKAIEIDVLGGVVEEKEE